MRTVIRLVLEQADYEVEEAANGRVALERLADGVPDLVLVDAKMPQVTGVELSPFAADYARRASHLDRLGRSGSGRGR